MSRVTTTHLALGCIMLTLTGISTHSSALEFSYNGFGSVVVGKATNTATLPDGSESSYLVDNTAATDKNGARNSEARYKDDWSVHPDTNFGFQGTATTESGISGTLQLNFRGSREFDPYVEWAFLTYPLTSSWGLKVGRQGIPAYWYSDYLDVGYAYHWLRPPVEVYGEGFRTFTGGSLHYHDDLGPIDTQLQFSYGDTKNDEGQIWRSRGKDAWGMVASGTLDWLTVRGSYHRSDDAYVAYAQPSVPALNQNKENGITASFTSLGFKADFNRWFLAGEYVQLELSPSLEAVSADQIAPGLGLLQVIGHRKAYMLTAGYRIDDLTLHATYAERTVSFAIPAIAPLASHNDQITQTWITGIRWDFHPNMALKAELTRAKDDSDRAVQQVLGKTQENTVFAMGIDYVF